MLVIVIEGLPAKNHYQQPDNAEDYMCFVEPHEGLPLARRTGETSILCKPLVFSLLDLLFIPGIKNQLVRPEIRFVGCYLFLCGQGASSLQEQVEPLVQFLSGYGFR